MSWPAGRTLKLSALKGLNNFSTQFGYHLTRRKERVKKDGRALEARQSIDTHRATHRHCYEGRKGPTDGVTRLSHYQSQGTEAVEDGCRGRHIDWRDDGSAVGGTSLGWQEDSQC